ncbi:MAG: hypothetical protein M1820_001557 [Bogoriella megaspora]|nr:MAG: hypothetical protein M1820_001557 [Bogoriella megaspora]
MSERKVITKYYPPDFDPALITRQKGVKQTGPRLQPVRLMAPFSMRCLSCGEYIYKGRKFNARKETSDEHYYNIVVYRFYIRCTRCSNELVFKTDPKNMDYTCERGAKRSFEPWREAKLAEETEEERLDRLQREEEERDPMKELEAKAHDAKQEMEVADALDQIRTRNARLERAEGQDGKEITVKDRKDEERERQDREDAEAARKAFERAKKMEDIVIPDEDDAGEGSSGEETKTETPKAEAPKVETTKMIEEKSTMPPPSFSRIVKKKKDFGAALGIKKKASLV